MKELVRVRPDRSVFEYKFLTKESQRETVKRRSLDLVAFARGKAMVIFLDKTARPFSQLFISLYRFTNPGEPLPAIRFINIGSEKGWPIVFYLKRKLGINYSGRLRENLEIFNQDGIVKLFGQEKIDYLHRLLLTDRSGEERLVVDDLIYSGTTRSIALRILSGVDKRNNYLFFAFLKSDSDLDPFCDHGRVPFLPWHSSSTLVADTGIENDLSFQVNRQEGGWRFTQGLVVRHELRQLYQEIISEHCSAHRDQLG